MTAVDVLTSRPTGRAPPWTPLCGRQSVHIGNPRWRPGAEA